MAVGTGAGIDVSALQRALSLLDTQLNGIITKSKAADASIKEMFRGNSGKALNNQIRQIRDDVVALSKIKDPFIWDSGSLKAYIAQLDNLMNVVRVMNSTTGKTGFKRIIPINPAELAEAKKELMSMLKLVQSNEAALAAKTSARNQTYSGAMRYSSNASTLEQERQAILNLTAAREKLKKSDADYANKLERVNQAIRKHEKNIRDATRTSKERADQAQRDAKKIADAERRIAREQSQQRRQSYERYASSYDGATRISDKAFKRGSIEQEEKAVRRLEAARKKLSKTDADYEKKLANLNRRIQQHNKNIERAKQGTQSLNGAHTRLGRTAASLASRFAILWGVQLIRGFVNQLVEVRGEMELQQRALQAILQNKEKADEVWSKTIALAVKSPFQIKDLVTYTRQLAAYRIEADKLFDTNKMLADVSAGLGVDMSRLILAYGQVRAANYLRGTELRQFTEAGVPMLEELAKYFDEVKGKALSVGEVFQMVSKRMVSFADVEAVLKRMTSAGGVFYNMQEIQSQTLKGQVSNLKDAIQLMFNEIGEANDGTLKNTIGVLKSMVRNWRIIAAVIKTAGVTLATYFGSRAIGAIVVGIANIASGIRSTDAALKAMSTSNVITLILTAVAALGTALYQALNYTDALAASLANIELGAIKDIEDNIRLYQELAEASQDVTKSISERNTALNNLQDKFKDILPDQYTELQYIKSLSGEYKEVKQAMEDYYSSKAMQLKKTKIEEIYEKELQDTDIPELVNDYINWASTQKRRGKFTDKDFHKVQVSINSIIQEIVQKAMEGEIDLSRPQNLSDAINKRLSEYIGKTIDMGATHNVLDLRMTLAKRASALRNLTSGLGKSFEEDMEIKNLQDIKARFQKAKQYYDEYVNILSDFVKGNITIEQLASEQQRVLANYKNDPLAVEGIAIQMENAFKELDNAVRVGEEFDFQKRIPEWKKSFLSAIYKDTISQEGLATTTNNFTNLLIEPLKDEIKALDTSDFQDTIVKVAEDIADKFNVDLDIFKEFIPQSKDTLDIIKQNVKSLIDSYKESIREYNTAIEEAPQADIEKILGITKDEVDKMTKSISALEAFWHALGGDSKDTKANAKEQEKILTKRVNLIKQMFEDYKKAKEKLGAIKAEELIRNNYKKAFEEAFEDTGINLSGLRIEESSLNNLIAEAQNAGNETGEAFSEAMLAKMAEVAEKGTYIRDITAEAIDLLREHEDIRNKAYQDSGGVWTIGMGQIFNRKENRPVQEGDYWTDEEILMYSQEEIKSKKKDLNDILDLHKDILITQEQYNQLFNATWQGGKGSTSALFRYAKDAEAFKGWLEEIDNMPIVKVLLDDNGNIKERRQVGLWDIDVDAEIKKFNELESVYDRLALVMNYISVRDAKNKDTTQSMIDRAKGRADAFRGDLTVVKLLQKAAIDVSEIDFTNITGVVAILERLRPLAEKEGKEAENALNKEIAHLKGELGFEVQKDEDARLKKTIQEMFDNYKLSIELREIKLPDEVIAKFIDGALLDLPTLREGIATSLLLAAGDGAEAIKGELGKSAQDIDKELLRKYFSEDMVNAISTWLTDIDNLIERQQKKSATRFAKFLIHNLDQTRVISTQLANDINYAFGQFKEGNIDAATFAEVMKNAMEEAREETSKFNLDKFKKSPEYIMAMGDMSSYTTKELRDLLTTLEKVVAESSHLFSADEAKAYHDAIAKARKELEQQEKPLKMFGNVSKIAKILELEEKISKEKENQAKFEKDKKDKEAEINNIKGLLATAKEELQGMASDSPDLASQVLKVDGLKEQLKVAQAGFQGIEGNLASSAANMSSMGAELSSMTGGSVSFVAIIDAIVHGINDTVQGVKEIVDEIAAVQESFGRETDMSTDIGKAAHIMGTFSKASQAATDAWDSLKSGDGMGVIVGVIKSWTEWIKGINAYKDAINEVSIAHHLEEVENLKDAYERLEWIIGQAFAFDRYGKIAEQQNNLTQQIENTYKAIALEEDKKDADEDRIKELRKNIEDTEEQIEELFDSLREDLIGSYEDMGETLADAMIEALKSGEDAIKAWGESVDEIVQGIVQKLLVQKYLEPRISDMVDEYYSSIMPKSANAERAWENYLKAKERGDSKAADDYLAQFDKLTQQAIGETPKISQQATLDFANKLNDLGDEFLRLMPDWFKEMLTASSGGGLTALQKGIQGVTEQTAQVIESLLNSMRAYQADSNVELKNQTRILSNIYNILNNSTSGTQVAINTRLLK